MPAPQFGFQKELSREHALFSVFDVLVEVKGSHYLLDLCALDIV